MTSKIDPSKAFESMTSNVEQFAAPVRELSNVAIQNVEKLAEAQIDSYRKYTAIGLENMKAAFGVKDVKGAQDFFANQRDVVKQVTDQLATDAKTFAELSSTFVSAMQKSSQETIDKAAKKAA